MANKVPPPLFVHLVHGTWPYGRFGKARWEKRRRRDPKDVPLPWFHPGSEFCEEVQRQAGRPVKFVRFEWSGSNSFTARLSAAKKLRGALEASLRAEPAPAKHIVIAHSHGGTVAYEALARGGPLSRPLAGLVTMGTPFAALRELQADLIERTMRMVSSHRWMFFLVCCAIVAYALTGWIHDAPFRPLVWIPPLALLVTFVLLGRAGERPVAALLADLLPTATLAHAMLTASWFSWSEASVGSWLIFMFAAALFVWLALFKIAPHWWFRPPDGLADLLSPLKAQPLECPFTLLRTPGDEASLSIALAQAVDWVLTRVSIRGLVGLPGRLLGAAEERWGFLFTVFLWLVAALGFACYDALFGEGLEPLWVYPISGILGVGIAFLFGGVLVLAVLAPITTHLGTLALRLATGPAVLRYAGLVAVEVEPAPAGVPATLEVLQREGASSQEGLSHSLHELSVTRRRVGKILAQS